MKMLKKFTASFCVLFLLSSCSMNKQQGGTLIGAGAGALLGSQFGKGSGKLVGVGLGAILGGVLGNQIGSYMDEQDKMKMAQTTQTTLEKMPSGQASTWVNPDSGHSGSVVAQKTYQNNGRYCREFTQTVNIGGKSQSAYGTACRQPDGSWEIVK